MIIGTPELQQIREENVDCSIALRFGSYDILHAGHQAGIDFAKQHADILVVGVMPDSYIQKQKGLDRPVIPEQERVTTIDRAKNVDYSFIAGAGAFAVAGSFVRLRPDIYVESIEYGASKVKSAFLRAIGTRYIIDELVRLGPSTTGMIAEFGREEARNHSSLSYKPVRRAG